ncbi:Lipase 1 [Hartmannibacter diazotrophicus]|uniref:Lipase 1 n=1 Tax=Hartmannibacter diazotrophicus TaxID=1482074 RepID=A0A2C9DD64_9HYPH|nr:alpha/beta fold hydrolase [Hartmannibacter diazotrophicus]SON57555.1 Lipase 1 [Hartmannibacter diazotrophicus]
MRPCAYLAAFILAATSAISSASADPIAGYDRMDMLLPHRARPVDATVWYPVKTPTYRGLVGDDAVFRGTYANVGAAVADGTRPLVLLSHGSGGNMDSLGWLSSALARRGMMVLAVNHPGSTSGDSSPRRSLRFDERAADLSAALDKLLADPAFGPHVDRSHVTALGFSLGGATALHLGGARLDPQKYREYCDRFGAEAADCHFFARGSVDFTDVPKGFTADAKDPRVTTIVTIDPGMTYGMTEQSLSSMNLPVLLINLIAPPDWKGMSLGLAGDVGPKGSDLAHRLPRADYVRISPAIHYTFLGLCKPDAAQILREEEDDPICDDPAATDRAAIHARIVDEIAAFLSREH